ncbi:hypothetical protein CUU66_01310 [Peribacillus deserti]|uniref:Uncharacterized protein n=1 Tax=Peribacillus deserti TaxID=673318 RepID=A0A2N5MBU2_9BACI|nr:hypothetical protein CUU66_01310 [Peribacillus deserti]
MSKDHVSKFNTQYHYYDFFLLEKNYFEIGLTAVVKMDTIFEEYIRDLPAQDRELEINKFEPVLLKKNEIEKFLKNKKVYNQGLFTLKMVCAREFIFINIKNNRDIPY